MCKLLVAMVIVLTASISLASFSMEDYLKIKPEEADKIAPKVEPVIVDFPAGILAETSRIVEYKKKVVEIQGKIKALELSITRGGGLEYKIARLQSKLDGYKAKEDTAAVRVRKDGNIYNVNTLKNYRRLRLKKDEEIKAIESEIKNINREISGLKGSLRIFFKKIKGSESKIKLYQSEIDGKESK